MATLLKNVTLEKKETKAKEGVIEATNSVSSNEIDILRQEEQSVNQAREML